jgi:ABC transporter substrate binding protein (PQQ-dependent alcohol dehydrogenase system)
VRGLGRESTSVGRPSHPARKSAPSPDRAGGRLSPRKREEVEQAAAPCISLARRWATKCAALAALACLADVIFCGAASAQEPATPKPAQRVTIGVVEIEGDPRYEPVMVGRLVLKAREHPIAGAALAIDEARALTRVLKIDFALERMRVKSADAVAPAVLEAITRGIQHFLMDAPAEAYRPLLAAVRGRDALLFNVSAPDDVLRRELCVPELAHTLPSLAMTMDGLAQYLVSRKWRDVLVLEGPLAADAGMAATFAQSLKKFGGRIVAQRNFKPGTDPRERELNNPLLLTAIPRDYDAVFVADHAFEFAREVPYRTVRARPVVGSIDLEPVAWHWTWEHNGGPQVNARFHKLTGGRRMESADWAARMAVNMVVKAALATRSADFRKQRDFILGGAPFDGDKGVAVTVRRWDQQLRQAVLLATPYGVAARAPIEGFLHRTNDLDTLGDDEGDSPCRLGK